MKPSSFPTACEATLNLVRLFERSFVSQRNQGLIKSADVDFIEGENGMLYFSKISNVYLTGRHPSQKKWVTSVNYNQEPMFNLFKATCQVNLICGSDF